MVATNHGRQARDVEARDVETRDLGVRDVVGPVEAGDVEVGDVSVPRARPAPDAEELAGGAPVCPVCAEPQIMEDGPHEYAVGLTDQLRCRSCGAVPSRS